MSILKFLEHRTERFIDALYALLVTTDDTQFFPEMYEIFGRESVVKFLDIFAGQTIRVPSREVVEKNVKDAIIWVEVQKGEKTLPQIAEFHEVGLPEIQRSCNRVQEALNRLGISVIETGD